MMYSATLEKTVRPICRKFCQDVRSFFAPFFILLLLIFCSFCFYFRWLSWWLPSLHSYLSLPPSFTLSLPPSVALSRCVSHTQYLLKSHTLLLILFLSIFLLLLPLHSQWRSLSMMTPSSHFTVCNNIISNSTKLLKTGTERYYSWNMCIEIEINSFVMKIKNGNGKILPCFNFNFLTYPFL